MRIGILQCDDVTPELIKTHGNYPDMFETLLRGADASLTFRTWRCLEDEIPTDVNEADAWLVTGSKFGVNDGMAWIDHLGAFLRKLWEADKPLVGVCFGHQLIARALGGEVVKSPRGWGVGVSFNHVTEREPWMEPWQPNLDLLVSHQDQVERLPPQTRVLASSEFCPYYLMQVGDHFLGIQGHPEFAKGYSHDLMKLRRNEVGGERVDQGLASLDAPLDTELMARWILNFMRRGVSQPGC